jgi:hypothetical protein
MYLAEPMRKKAAGVLSCQHPMLSIAALFFLQLSSHRLLCSLHPLLAGGHHHVPASQYVVNLFVIITVPADLLLYNPTTPSPRITVSPFSLLLIAHY